MYYKLYIDSVFILQLTTNLYLLSLAGRFLRCTATHGKKWLGAVTGALLSCLMIMIPVGNMGGRMLISALPVSMCMMCITYRIHSMKKMIHSSLVMAGCGFFLGSVMIWILNRLRVILKGRGSLFLTLLISYLAYRILAALFGIVAARSRNSLRTVRFYVPALRQEIKVSAFVDTGNHLVDPVSGKPVSVISEKIAQCMTSCFMPEKYHAVPYQSVGKDKGLLNAYEVPEIIIESDKQEIRKEHVIVAICDTGISEESVYQMILHPRLLEN
ncbi:hypothetical protein D7V83_06330 [bacterium 0.1xD8-71]|nr:hypothetical protein D7V83_06330 [bacterium 0.1xD8-71]